MLYGISFSTNDNVMVPNYILNLNKKSPFLWTVWFSRFQIFYLLFSWILDILDLYSVISHKVRVSFGG